MSRAPGLNKGLFGNIGNLMKAAVSHDTKSRSPAEQLHDLIKAVENYFSAEERLSGHNSFNIESRLEDIHNARDDLKRVFRACKGLPPDEPTDRRSKS